MTEGQRTRRVKGRLSDAVAADSDGVVIQIHGDVEWQEPVKQGRKSARERKHRVFALVDARNAMARLEFTGLEGRVFWTVAAAADPTTNECRITGEQIAARLDTVGPSISRALKELRDRRILISTGRSQWMVNPWISYYGRAEDWETVTLEHPEPEWSRS